MPILGQELHSGSEEDLSKAVNHMVKTKRTSESRVNLKILFDYVNFLDSSWLCSSSERHVSYLRFGNICRSKNEAGTDLLHQVGEE